MLRRLMLALVATAGLMAPERAAAQGNDVIWVLFPYGARAAGMGKALTA